MAGIYRLNEVVKIDTTFKVSDVLTDPTTVTLAVTNPSGTITTYLYGTNVELVKDSVGTYHLNVTANQLGLWQYVWTGTGAVESVKESYLTVTQGASIPLVAGQDIGTTVRTVIGDSDASNQEFSDTQLAQLLTRAINFYSRFRPYYLQSSITTVLGQSDYLAPSNAMKMVEVDYRLYPGLSTNTYVAFFNALYGSADILPMRDWRDDVLNKIRQEYAVRFDEIGVGKFGMVQYSTSYSNQNYIRLYPTPTRDGDVVNITYTATHPLQNNNYFTIAPHHVIYIEKLLEAEVKEVRVGVLESNPIDVSIGTTRVQIANSTRALRMSVSSLRQEVIDALSVPVGTHG